MKILVVSDNHGNGSLIRKVLQKHQDADYYFHLGDSEMESYELRPFVSVKGNNDYDFTMPLEKIIEVGDHSFYLCHGHFYGGDPNLIAQEAYYNECDFALFGHTHEPFNEHINGIRVINPGSIRSNRNDGKSSYCLIEIGENDEISIDFEEI